jgi:hypothetical protein
MNDEPTKPTIPDRPPLRELRERGPEADMRQAAATVHQSRALELRTQARRDAAIVVSRARERAGIQRTVWTGHDVDVLHAITELLLQVQGQDRRAQTADEAFKTEGA